MRKIALLAVIVLAGTIIATGCKYCQKTEQAPAAPGAEQGTPVGEKGAKANNETISEQLSKSLCKRMVECAQGVMTEDECVTQTKTSLMEALKEKALDITTAQLDTCINKINTCDCKEVMGTEPPAGCEFLN